MVQVAPAEAADIQLLKDEESSMGLMMDEGITTISFYKGELKPAAEALRAQFALVAASNAWLAGRLVKTKAGVRLRHPASPSATDINSLFTATSAEDAAAFKLTPTSPYTKICTNMYKSKMIVGSGKSILGKNQPVALLTLSESAPSEFALIFSISHVVADGDAATGCCRAGTIIFESRVVFGGHAGHVRTEGVGVGAEHLDCLHVHLRDASGDAGVLS
ncbi:hypothetical protein T484DRAFT_1982044, partial [Baffinella frigidus]